MVTMTYLDLDALCVYMLSLGMTIMQTVHIRSL